jgi:hypothetical protein
MAPSARTLAAQCAPRTPVAAGEIENALAFGDASSVDERWRPRAQDVPGDDALVHVGGLERDC